MARCRAKISQFLGPNVYSGAPDGGWGWVVALAFFLVEVFTYGTIKIFGIFLQDLMNEFEESNSRVSWIVSICIFVMTFNGPLSSMMTNQFGFQVVVMIGGLLISTGTIATSFCSSINQIYITYGLVAGMGYCLTFLPTVTILSQYFNRRRSLVIAVASTGESLSMFALAPAFSALKENIGWRHTVALLGALQSVIIVCGVLLRPIIIKPGSSSKELEALRTLENSDGTNPEDSVTKDNEPTGGSVSTGDSGIQSLKDSSNLEENNFQHKEAKLETEPISAGISKAEMSESETEKTDRDAEKQELHDKEAKPDTEQLPVKLLDFSILRECSFILYSLFGLFATLGFFAPPLYIIDLSVSRGVEREHAAYMLSTMAVAEILGRFSIGWILTWKHFSKRKLQVLLACVITMTVDLVGFTLVTELYGLAVCCAFYGFFMGTLACTHIPMLAEDDVVGIERMSSSAGVYVFIHSFAGLAGPPLGGVLVDVTNNYGAAFYSCAVGMGLSAVFLVLVRPAKRGFPCWRRGCKKQSGGQKPDERTNSTSNCSKSDCILDVSQTGAQTDVDEGTA
ncbi:monocarboxylate transporter 7-like [Melanotaenia boesemani]|uniref:monocarboxylate transporter 7-like n=1 Tax=Melanotaenia boesemani TaxID=1250792 RepID=UPI001C045D83|nr:monocarboxylate transporter 7-like [Melanotaenia boesemani]XP_041829522.1 monocarboxylate transporter 7-like [Melanotaenia boesemani]XP_041829523.1 monocarboxylate transporter 7-like [Melanotaenia boesemani]XP_041829525.1 monocarboxylate transporter 7-like [Melanotaenia boesemani]